MFTYVSPEARISADHPLRPIRGTAETVLRGLSAAFDELYAQAGRLSIPPERLRPATSAMVRPRPVSS